MTANGTAMTFSAGDAGSAVWWARRPLGDLTGNDAWQQQNRKIIVPPCGTAVPKNTG